MPVAPPTTAIGLWPAFWKRRSMSSDNEVADVQAVGRGVEAGVQRARLSL